MSGTVPFLLAVDSSLGKVDKAALSNQTLLEILVGGITNSEKIIPNPEEPTKYAGIIRRSEDEILLIDWDHRGLQGSLALEWLPRTLGKVSVHTNKLSGTISLTDLPESLFDLQLTRNNFSGSLDLTKLPKNLQFLSLGHNQFKGNADFSKIPGSVIDLDVSNNPELSGEVHYFSGRRMLSVHHTKIKDFGAFH